MREQQHESEGLKRSQFRAEYCFSIPIVFTLVSLAFRKNVMRSPAHAGSRQRPHRECCANCRSVDGCEAPTIPVSEDIWVLVDPAWIGRVGGVLPTQPAWRTSPAPRVRGSSAGDDGAQEKAAQREMTARKKSTRARQMKRRGAAQPRRPRTAALRAADGGGPAGQFRARSSACARLAGRPARLCARGGGPGNPSLAAAAARALRAAASPAGARRRGEPVHRRPSRARRPTPPPRCRTRQPPGACAARGQGRTSCRAVRG